MNTDKSDLEASEHALPPGWKALYRSFVAQMAADHPDVRIVGCYAKLGSLRVHLTDCDGAASRLADEFAKRSKRTCEVCGSAGLIVPVPPSAVVHALCEVHAPPGVYAGVARLGAIARERYRNEPSVYRSWVYRKHSNLGGRMPIDLIAEGRIDEVIRWLPKPALPTADNH